MYSRSCSFDKFLIRGHRAIITIKAIIVEFLDLNSDHPVTSLHEAVITRDGRVPPFSAVYYVYRVPSTPIISFICSIFEILN